MTFVNMRLKMWHKKTFSKGISSTFATFGRNLAEYTAQYIEMQYVMQLKSCTTWYNSLSTGFLGEKIRFIYNRLSLELLWFQNIKII